MNTLFKAVFASAITLAMPVVAAAQSCPDYSVSGYGLSYTAETAYMPQSTSVVAGGNIDLGACGSVPGMGYIVQNPDFTMQYNDLGMGRALEIRVNGSCDTVLLVNGANGQWYFNDDASGLNPGIRLSGAQSGQYDIWVGTLAPSTCDAVLTIETF